jgi:hypothetical protein
MHAETAVAAAAATHDVWHYAVFAQVRVVFLFQLVAKDGAAVTRGIA